MTFDLVWIALVLAALPAANGLVSLILLRAPRGPGPDGALVSILIPARDEAANIAACLDAALAQRGVAIEVLVMDDGSTDGTPDIVRRHAARDPRLRLLHAPPLPPGWSGKMHACARLADAARGTHLLFIDADVRLAPGAAADLSAHATRHRLGLVSGLPRQRIDTLGEALTVPMIGLLLLGYLPGAGRAFTRFPAFAAGCGQMMLFTRGAYDATGGHAALRATLHDGLNFPRRLRAAGHRTELINGAPLATCRMYRGFGEAWRGFLKNAREGMATPAGLPVWTILLAGAHLWPLLLLPDPRALLAIALSFALRTAVTLRLGEPAWTIAAHPAGVAVALVIQWTALVRALLGRREGWKGRDYAGGGRRELPPPHPPQPSLGLEASRTARGENFPVASLLLRRDVRAKVLGFYRFVRTADDIADSAALTPAEKHARLDALEAALDDPGTTEPAARPLHDSGCGTGEARRMLAAFRQDATQRRYADWAALEAYCAASANSVGRMLLRLHGEARPEAVQAADALATALQILNHLQDLTPDRDALDRIYLPEPWLDVAGGEAVFFADAARRRAVLDASLDRVEERLDAAAALPRLIAARRLALEAAVTLALARRLLARLRAGDPVAARVALSRADFARAFAAAPFGGPPDAALVRARVRAAGSSFARGMSALRGDRRRALWAVYAFCRAVDDIADGAMPEAEKRRFLADWRAKLARPDCALSRELARARDRYALPVAECEAMIAGMETDAAPAIRIADAAALDLYCRRVAGSVGAMAVRIFGAPEAAGFGLALGRTLQLVNILRDLDEDAARDRVYLPLDLLAAHGVPDGPASRILAAPGTTAAAQLLAAQVAAGFAQAEAELRALDGAALLPARIMMWGYRRLFDRLLARGFGAPRIRPRLTRGEKARMAAYALRLAPVAAR